MSMRAEIGGKGEEKMGKGEMGSSVIAANKSLWPVVGLREEL